MRHARQNLTETQRTLARIVTGSHRTCKTHWGRASGRTYSQLARRIYGEPLYLFARDRSPAMKHFANQTKRAGEPLFKFAGPVVNANPLATAGERGGQS